MKPEKRPAQEPIVTGITDETRQHALSSPIEEALAIDLTLPYRCPLPHCHAPALLLSPDSSHTKCILYTRPSYTKHRLKKNKVKISKKSHSKDFTEFYRSLTLRNREIFNDLTQSLTTMANAIFDIKRKFGHGAVEFRDPKERIIAEATLTLFLTQDHPFDTAF